MPPDQQAFFTEFGLTEADLIAAKISWAELTAIFTDYIPRSEDLNSVAEVVSRILRREERTHSVRLRLKDPLHVMEKVVRKRQANADRDITASNYLDQLTDLVGVRVLHLYKEDWQRVHDHIVASFTLKEKPTIYHRRGDEVVGASEEGCEVKEHRDGYRSVHYIVEQSLGNRRYYAEVQVRTIFEEGWSEVDHQIRYPHTKDVAVINEYLMVFNRLAGTADEMSTYLRRLAADHAVREGALRTLQVEKARQGAEYEREIQALRKKIAAIEKKPEREAIAEALASLERLRLDDTTLQNTLKLVSGSNMAAFDLLNIPRLDNETQRRLAELGDSLRGVNFLDNGMIRLTTASEPAFDFRTAITPVRLARAPSDVTTPATEVLGSLKPKPSKK